MPKSLMDGLDMEKKPAKAKKAGNGSGKLYLSVALLVIAVGVLVWFYFPRSAAPEIKIDPVEQQQAAEAAQQNVREAQSRGAQIGGGY